MKYVLYNTVQVQNVGVRLSNVARALVINFLPSSSPLPQGLSPEGIEFCLVGAAFRCQYGVLVCQVCMCIITCSTEYDSAA